MTRPDDELFNENTRTATDQADTLAQLGPMTLVSGAELPDVTVAYRTWGELNAARDNAILVCHALSGNADAATWWERLIGPGKALDTDKYYVVGTNALGGCNGTTGPASLAFDGIRYGARFPIVQLADMIDAQARLTREVLGIDQWALVAGGSMGGMQALEWSVRHPAMVKRVWMTASCAAHSAMQIGFNEAARQAILRDPLWEGGNYASGGGPVNGLSVARMIGHLSYLSEASFEYKFGRGLQEKSAIELTFKPEFKVESYLNYQGDKFCHRFDAASFIFLTKAIDYYSCDSLALSQCSYLFTSFNSDWLYPSWQSAQLHNMAVMAGRPSRHIDIDSPWGHDSFLLNDRDQADAVRNFLI